MAKYSNAKLQLKAYYKQHRPECSKEQRKELVQCAYQRVKLYAAKDPDGYPPTAMLDKLFYFWDTSEGYQYWRERANMAVTPREVKFPAVLQQLQAYHTKHGLTGAELKAAVKADYKLAKGLAGAAKVSSTRLDDLFVWGASPKGHDYWSDRHHAR